MGLNKEQQEAVSYLEGPLLVLAGPGTGKTQLLSAKVAYILEHTDANPENILCLTFTESGASNMRERLGSMVGRAASNVHIYTYHAFGSNILDRYKNYSDTFNRNLDSVIDTVTQYKIIKNILEQLPATDILKTADISDLTETIGHAKSARLSSKDLAMIAKQNIADSQTLSDLVTPLLQKLKPRQKLTLALEEVYQPLLEALINQSSPDPITGNIERTANILARELADLIKESESSEKPSISPFSKWKTKRFECQADGSYRLKDYIANKKLASLAYIMAKYDEALRSEGLFDFADMIEEAIRALKEDRGFRLTMSELFQYVLLDEFQDTNPSQFELIKLITDYEKPVVMAVGDDDQAIFEFQGASASNLLDFQNYYHAKVVTLLDNYRSTGEILDFSHQVAEQVKDSFAKQHGVAKILRSMQDFFRNQKLAAAPGQEAPADEKLPSRISRHEFISAQDEYYWVADQISSLIKAGESPEDIAIIAPKHKYIAPILPYLKQHDNINISYEKKSNLLEDPKIKEIITLASFVSELAIGHQPTHRVLEILSFPFLEVSALEALRAVEHARDQKLPCLDYLAQSDSSQLSVIADWLANLAKLSFEASLELWIDYAIGNLETPNCSYRSPYLTYYERICPKHEIFELYENLAALRNTVLSHTKTTSPKLADFVETISDYQLAGVSIMNTSPYQDGAHAIQIMSSHKSKGLEFKYVFMIAVDNAAWGPAKGNNNKFVLPSNLIQIRHTGATDDERLRLLFVAITRAKEHLIMTGSVRDFFDKENARLSYLNEQRDEKAEIQLSPYLPAPSQAIVTHYDDYDFDTHLETTRCSWTSNYQKLTPDLKLLLTSRLENYRLTATDLTSFIDIIYAGPEQVYRSRILCAPSEPLTEQLAYGNLIHAVYEQISNQGINDQDAYALYDNLLSELPLAEQEIQNLREKGLYSLKISLQQFSDILRHPHAKAEVNLSPEHPTLDGIPLTGKIDHININPTDKTIEVYDFKTGKYHDCKWQSHPTLYKYSLQLGFYKLLLNLSPTYRNYRVTKAHILFVTPDAEERVYDKVYDYDQDEEQGLKDLMKAVYHQITTLDFVENPDLNLPADKSHTLKDIRAFIAKLLELSQKS